MKFNPKEVAEWLFKGGEDGASDEEFVETFVALQKMRNDKTLFSEKDIANVEIKATDIVNLDTEELCKWIKETLNEIIHSEEVDAEAWWKLSLRDQKTPIERNDVIGGLMKMAVTNTNDEQYEGAMQLASILLGVPEDIVANMLYDGTGGEENG